MQQLVSQEAYTWAVTYANGVTIAQYDQERPNGRGFLEVPHTNVAALELSGGHIVAIPVGATPVFFRRHFLVLDPNTGEERRASVYCIGWRRETNGCYLFIRDDGFILLSDNIQAV